MNLNSATTEGVTAKAAKSTGLKTWEKRVAAYEAGTPIPESLIVALRSALSRGPHDLRMFLCGGVIVNCVKWSITDSQTEKGLAWLRRSNVQKSLTVGCKAILDDFSNFTFEGVEVVRALYRESYLPVYRVHSKNHGSFAYSSSPWQDVSNEGVSVLGEVSK